MPSVCNPRKATWLSLSVHTNVSGTPAAIPERFLLSLTLNGGETERPIENTELAQEPPHPTPDLTGKKQKFFCKSKMLNWLGAQARETHIQILTPRLMIWATISKHTDLESPCAHARRRTLPHGTVVSECQGPS